MNSGALFPTEVESFLYQPQCCGPHNYMSPELAAKPCLGLIRAFVSFIDKYTYRQMEQNDRFYECLFSQWGWKENCILIDPHIVFLYQNSLSPCWYLCKVDAQAFKTLYGLSSCMGSKHPLILYLHVSSQRFMS